MAYAEGIVIGTYVLFRDRDGVAITSRAYQNFFIAESRNYENSLYLFAPFGIQGDLASNASDSSTATIVLPANALSVSLAAEAALNRWLLEAKYVLIGPTVTVGGQPVFTEVSTIATDLWVCSGYRQVVPVVAEEENEQAITLELISPINAVEARTPNCVLQDWQVGSLPVTGNVLLS
jgi:hypothetical protein